MPDRMIQAPVSLIERARDALIEVPPSSRNADIYGELSALLSQPTPSAEPERSYTAADVQEAFERGCIRGEQDANERNWSRRQYEKMQASLLPAAPPSIAAMAPGTTFRGQHVQGAGLDTREVLWTVDRATDPHGPLVESETGTWRYTTVDRSTIRDVQDPPATPEAD